MSQNDGGPAFPFPTTHSTADAHCPRCGGRYRTAGMTLRDYFAAQAIAGLMTVKPLSAENDARFAYEVADAMLAERAK